MSILTSVIGGVAAVASGGTLGVIGAIGAGVVDIFRTRESNKQQLAVIAAQTELAKANSESATMLESLKLISGSYENDKETYVNTKLFSVDGYRGTFRPNACYLLLGLSMWLTYYAITKVGLSAETLNEVAIFAVYTCLNLTATCVSWWFGSRQMDKLRRK